MVLSANASLESLYLYGSQDCYFAERTFGIKAKLGVIMANMQTILPKGLLESRQSRCQVADLCNGFCRKDFWNQGKARGRFSISNGNFAERTFGIKAKRKARLRFARRHFAERTFGIKAKQEQSARCFYKHFAERTFGIKAKPDWGAELKAVYFAERTFGIKAKL